MRPPAALPWDELPRLHVLRRVGELVERRFGVALGYAPAVGEVARQHAGCAPHAHSHARLAAGAAAYACPLHPGWHELAAPILVDGRYQGCVLGRALPGADLALLGELVELCAGEVAAFAAARAPDGAEPAAAETDADPPPRYRYDGIIGRSRVMRDLCRLLDKVIDSDSTILIQGDNGTGKELFARAIHYNSRRAGERFVVQNCSAFNDNLLDSELFGHKKGAFTGAIADKQGLFEVADHGTFFLDEVGDMSPSLQVKLLRVLQEGTFLPVGDTVTRSADVRIIAATHRDLKAMVERGEFREDLYYRINVIHIVVPPLRERTGDIPILVDHFLRRYATGRRVRPKRLTRGCLERLVEHAWPGNIRELENEIERLVVLSGDELLIDEPLLSPRLQRQAAGRGQGAGSLTEAVDAVERDLIHEALKKNQWNKTRAARELCISRRNLIRKVDKYKLDQRRAR